MPRESAPALQLPLFVSDPAASPEALTCYEALRPVLTGQRSLRQQSYQTGISYWRLWRDLRRFRRHGLLGLVDRRTLPHSRGRPAVETLLPRHLRQHIVRLPSSTPSSLGNRRVLSETATTMPLITMDPSACSPSMPLLLIRKRAMRAVGKRMDAESVPRPMPTIRRG
jgi:hypothetical protein